MSRVHRHAVEQTSRELDFALQLARAVVVQARSVALSRREVNGREIRPHEGPCRRPRGRAEGLDGYSSEQCCDEEAHRDMSRLYSVTSMACGVQRCWVARLAALVAANDRSHRLRNRFSSNKATFARQI